MRIVHIISSLHPKRGGPPVVATRLAAAEAQLGHEVVILAHGTESERDGIDAVVSNVPGMDRVQIELFPPRRGLRKLPAKGLRARIAALAHGETFVQVHGVWEPMIHAAASEAHRRGVPFAITPHGMLDRHALQFKQWRKRMVLALGYRRTLQRAAFLHALNANEAEAMSVLSLATPIVVLPNGVFLEEIDPLPNPGRFVKRFPKLAGKPYVLFLGRLHYMKGVDYLTDAFARLAAGNREVHLVVAGPDGGEQAALQQQVQVAGLGDRVHIVGALYGAEKFAAFVDASCFCQPSRREAFSIATTEAMACRVAVVITKNCNFPEVGEVGAGLVVDLNAGAIAAALEEVLSDAERRQAMGRAGRALIENRFTWPSIARRFVAVYQDVLAGRRPT